MRSRSIGRGGRCVETDQRLASPARTQRSLIRDGFFEAEESMPEEALLVTDYLAPDEHAGIALEHHGDVALVHAAVDRPHR